MMMVSVSFFFFIFFLASLYENGTCCNETEREALLSFISSPPLNWSQSPYCCQWQGVACDASARVTHLRLPDRHLSGTINPSFLANLPFLSHINLSRNHLSLLHHSPSSGGASPPLSIQTLDLSSNRFNGSFDPSFLLQASNLIVFNISNNTFTGSINPSSICRGSKLLKILDFSMNHFTGPISPGLAQCSNLQVFRAGSNSLSGPLPHDLYSVATLQEISLHDNQFAGLINNAIVNLSNLTILDLHFNQLIGEIPQNIGLLPNLEKLVLHTNTLNGPLPPSLTNCTKLKTLILRHNHFQGDISALNFSKLHQLQAIDLGSNAFTGNIPHTLCSCTTLVAVRFSHNQLVGEIPPCMASLKSLQHLAVANNNLSNVAGAFKTLRHCDNLVILILWGCFHDEMMPNNDNLGGFQKLQILTLEDCKLRGHIPLWIAKLRNLKQLDLSKNQISGTVPRWFEAMPSLCVLNLTQNLLSGHLPPQLGSMPALVSGNSSLDLSYLQLPLLIDGRQYNRLFNLRRGLAVGSNGLSGEIPQELGALKLLQAMDLSNNDFTGNIPIQISGLTNLESLNMSGNRLSGKIPESLTGLHFLSSLSLADNDLEGEVPRGGQFDTFPANSFEGNPNLCGFVINRSCSAVVTQVDKLPHEEKLSNISWYSLPFGLGYFLGLVAVATATLFKNSYFQL